MSKNQAMSVYYYWRHKTEGPIGLGKLGTWVTGPSGGFSKGIVPRLTFASAKQAREWRAFGASRRPWFTRTWKLVKVTVRRK